MDSKTKTDNYRKVRDEMMSVLVDEPDTIARMSTITGLLHNRFEQFFWTGFYRCIAPRELVIGPYQGTLGCLRIPFNKGVCGACATREETLIVDDTHLFPGHIACDSRSRSEIVVPVFGPDHTLIAVLDIDATTTAAFDSVDQEQLEQIVAIFRAPTNQR